jgi:hypothetical protein
MKILGIIAFVEIVLLVIVATITGIDIDLFLTGATPEIMAQILGGLIIIYPIVNMIMHSKLKLKNWHFLGVFMVVIYTILTMYLLAVIFRDPKYIQIDHVGYYMQTVFSIIVILILRKTNGIKDAIEEQPQ